MAGYQDWMEVAKVDLKSAEGLAQVGIYARASFFCQQAVEKALKAYLLCQELPLTKTHSLRELAAKAGVFEKLKPAVSLLDPDYGTSRYVDISGKPTRFSYSKKMFEERQAAAIEAVEMIESWMRV